MTIQATEAPSAIDPAAVPRPLVPVRAVVVGLGRAGIGHAAVLSTVPGCELVGLVDPRSDARRNARGLGYAAPGFASLEKLLHRVEPSAVIVSTADSRRAEIARLALESGAAVLIDRPFGASADEARRLVDLAAAKGRPLAAGHSLSYHPVFTRTREVLAAGALGKPRQVRSSMYLSRVFSMAQQRAVAARSPAGGGVVAQVSSDLLFLLIWYFGTPVSARAQWSRLYGELEDELHGMLTLADGVEVGFDSSWSVPGYPRPATVIELEGENGKLLASDDALELELIGPAGGEAAGLTRIGHAQLPHPARFDLDGEELYLQDSAFLAWVAGGPAPPNRAELALAVARVTETLYASARQGGRTLPVPA